MSHRRQRHYILWERCASSLGETSGTRKKTSASPRVIHWLWNTWRQAVCVVLYCVPISVSFEPTGIRRHHIEERSVSPSVSLNCGNVINSGRIGMPRSWLARLFAIHSTPPTSFGGCSCTFEDSPYDTRCKGSFLLSNLWIAALLHSILGWEQGGEQQNNPTMIVFPQGIRGFPADACGQ
jgi:hypothetical protein